MIRLGRLGVLVIVMLAVQVQAYSGGSGAPDDPYHIATYEDLVALGETLGDYDKSFLMTNDIDLEPNGLGISPLIASLIADAEVHGDANGIYPCQQSFSGCFDGAGHVIKNLRFRDAQSAGLFGILGPQGSIRNVILSDVHISGGTGVGPLVVFNDGGRIENCISTGTINAEGSHFVGGLVGLSRSGQMNGCMSQCEIIASDRVGGLVGSLEGGSLYRCQSQASISGNNYVGGLLGFMEEQAALVQCDSNSVVEGSYYVGGLVGRLDQGMVSECFSIGTVKGDFSVGGLIGSGGGRISRAYLIINCYSHVNVEGYRDMGGLVGYNEGGVLLWSHALGTVEGYFYVGGLVGSHVSGLIRSCHSHTTVGQLEISKVVGGLVGSNGSSSWSYLKTDDRPSLIQDSYAWGSVSGYANVGGLVGENVNDSIVSCCYSSGTVQAMDLDQVGGLIAKNEGKVINCFWDIQTSSLAISDGGIGLSTAEMQDQQCFLDRGWDFWGESLNGVQDRWRMPDVAGLPVLVPSPIPAIATYQGLGTLEDPYRIETVPQLLAMRYDPLAHYQLEQDLDLSGMTFHAAPLPWFNGVLLGQGYCIRSMNIEGNGYLGLVGLLGPHARVQDLTLTQVQIKSGQADDESGTMSVYYGSHVGGLAGMSVATILNCHAQSQIEGYCYVGGLVGENQGVLIGCTSDGETLGQGKIVGGLVGMNTGLALACSSTGVVAASGDAAGGLVAHNNGRVLNCFSTCGVAGDRAVGGLVGDNINGSVAYSYCTGLVTGNGAFGPLVGCNRSGYHKRSSNSTVNRLHKYLYYEGVVENCFWNQETSGLKYLREDYDGTGLQTTTMQVRQTYLDAGWDLEGETSHGMCDYWKMDEGQYPSVIFKPVDSASFGGGRGTVENPYVIRDAEALGKMWRDPFASFQIGADIDLSEVTWNSAIVPWFAGVLDGNDYTLAGMTIEGVGRLGLLGMLAPEAKVAHLKLQGYDVNGIYDVMGQDVDSWDDEDEIIFRGNFIDWIDRDSYQGYLPDDLFYKTWDTWFVHRMDSGWIPMVEQRRQIGGLAGLSRGRIEDCACIGTVRGHGLAGGVVGVNHGVMTRTASLVSIVGTLSVGGIAGESDHWIEQCYSQGQVRGGARVGGLVGALWGGQMSNSYSWARHNSGEDGYDCAALVGWYYAGMINACYSNSFDRDLIPYWMHGEVINSFNSHTDSRDLNDLLAMGWDFTQESENGEDDIWVWVPGSEPRLAWEGVDPNKLYSGGNGTPEDPYQIDTLQDFIYLASHPEEWYPHKHFMLTSDLDLRGLIWSEALIAPVEESYSLGYGLEPRWDEFYGSLNGNGHVIRNLSINGTNGLGLFGVIWSTGCAFNLGLEDVDIVGIGSGLGALAGMLYYQGQVTECYSTGSVSGLNKVGGLIGELGEQVVLKNSYSWASVKGQSNVGGLTGDAWGPLLHCYSTGPVEGSQSGGGRGGRSLVQVDPNSWWQWNEGAFEPYDYDDDLPSYTLEQMLDVNTYLIQGWDFLGEVDNGLHDIWQMPAEGGFPILTVFQENNPFMPVGSGTIEDPFVIRTPAQLGAMRQRPYSHYRLGTDLDLSGSTWRMAVVPEFWGTFDGQGHVIKNLTLVGYDNLGLFGHLYETAEIQRLGVVDVNISGEMEWECNSRGGGRGSGSTDPNDCSWVMEGGYNCGGLVGDNEGLVTHCYATGVINGQDDLGGLVGSGAGSMAYCYSAVTIQGDDDLQGLGGNSNAIACFWDTEVSGVLEDDGAIGLTTAEMQDINTYLNAGWDFVDETDNGTEDIWMMPDELGYPVLRKEF